MSDGSKHAREKVTAMFEQLSDQPMTFSRIPLPDAAYLARVGTVVYLVGRLEWAVLGELERLTKASRLAAGISLDKLAGSTTGAIAETLKKASTPDAAVTVWLHLAGGYLAAAAERRNHVLHSRPSAEGLYRWRNKPGDQFLITPTWLDDLIADLEAWCVEVEGARPT